MSCVSLSRVFAGRYPFKKLQKTQTGSYKNSSHWLINNNTRLNIRRILLFKKQYWCRGQFDLPDLLFIADPEFTRQSTITEFLFCNFLFFSNKFFFFFFNSLIIQQYIAFNTKQFFTTNRWIFLIYRSIFDILFI